jgi:hypothetical protein
MAIHREMTRFNERMREEKGELLNYGPGVSIPFQWIRFLRVSESGLDDDVLFSHGSRNGIP